MDASFNLVTQPWIPVRSGDRLIDLSLEQTLLEARHYGQIEDASPLVTAALHRFLLAVLHRALNGPSGLAQATAWFRDGFPTEPVRDYLARYHDRFDLFSPTAPFYQVADFTLDLSARSWTILAPELNSDNNKILFDHTVTAQPEPLRPAAAARLLIANQTFALSAGKSVLCHTATAPIATAAIMLVEGEDLHETLCLNLALASSDLHERDRASWEAPVLDVAQLRDCAAARGSPMGMVDRYTWPARAIRLHPEERDGETVIFRISYASGVRCEDPHDVPDPLVAYRRDPRDENRVYPIGYRRDGQALWRDFDALLPVAGGEDGGAVLASAAELLRRLPGRGRGARSTVQTMVLGQANEQAKIEFWRWERYRLPVALVGTVELRNMIRESLTHAKEVGRRLEGAARALAERLLTSGDRRPHRDDVARLSASFPHGAAYWSSLEEAFARWLVGLGPDAIERRGAHERAWAAIVEREARRAWGLTATAAGNDARALRAVYASEGLLMAYLYLAQQRRKEAA